MGRGGRAADFLSTIQPGPESVRLPASSDSSEAEEEEEVYTQPPSHSLQEDRPDQPALSPVIPPQGTSTSGDVTTPVADAPVTAQDPSFVSNDAPPSSSTPVIQEGTAANPVTVDVEVHEVPDSEQDEDVANEKPLPALTHPTLGTQTGSTLPSLEDSFQPPMWERMGNPERILTIDPAMPLPALVGRIHAHLSPVRGYASGSERIPALDGDDLVALEGYLERLGWEKLSTLQPLQVDRTGVRCLVKALRGTVIQLVHAKDNGSDTSDDETTGHSQLRSRSEQDPLGLNQGDSEWEEGECRPSPPDVMDQDEVLEHDSRPEEGITSYAGGAFGPTTDSQSEVMDVTGLHSETEDFSEQPMDAQDARCDRDASEPTWSEGENVTAKCRRKYPKVRPYAVPVRQENDNGWYQWEDIMDPNDVAPPVRRLGLPNVDGSIGGDAKYALPPPRQSRSNFYYNRELRRRVIYDRPPKSDKGHYPRISEEERVKRAKQQNTALQSDAYWENELAASHYLPTAEDSLVNFSYRVNSDIYVVSYHVVGPMTWEYPYHSGQAQEDLTGRLIPASLYGLMVTRPVYRSATARPATTQDAQAAYDSGRGFLDHISDTDVNAHAIPVGEVGLGQRGAALFVCVQLECAVAKGHEPLFATLEQWAAHWNTFHVAAAPAFNCMVRGCTYSTGTAPDALDSLFCHFQDAHKDVYANGKWTGLTELVVRGLKIRANAQYWPPTNTLGELQRPVAVTGPTALQLESPIVAARWAACEAFHKAVVFRRRSYKKAKCRESKSGERSSSASEKWSESSVRV